MFPIGKHRFMRHVFTAIQIHAKRKRRPKGRKVLRDVETTRNTLNKNHQIK